MNLSFLIVWVCSDSLSSIVLSFFTGHPHTFFFSFKPAKKQALHYTLEILWQGIENSTSLQETFISLAFNLLNHNSVKRLACLDWLCCSSAAHKSFWGCVVDCPPVSLQQETTVTRRTLCSGRCYKLLTSTDSSGAHFCVATEIWWGEGGGTGVRKMVTSP